MTRPRRSRWPCRRWTNLRQQQAASLAYFDDFWLFAVLALALVLLVLAHEALGGREGGAHRSGVDPTEWASWTV